MHTLGSVEDQETHGLVGLLLRAHSGWITPYWEKKQKKVK